jgi:hypothetical protein
MIFTRAQVDSKFSGRTANRQWRSLREPQVQAEILKL